MVQYIFHSQTLPQLAILDSISRTLVYSMQLTDVETDTYPFRGANG